uniref:Acireductone dioxygenase n=1 Tax=Ciona savignyi TaxID=51511 RepID=H2Z978_CIOSA
MVRAWRLVGDQLTDNPTSPDQSVSLDELAKLGVEYFQVDADTREENDFYKNLKKERGYSYSDLITVSPDTLPNYEQKVKSFFEEHLHTDEEIRFILDGSGFFDVRDLDDNWIRIEVVKNDLVILPAGIYHRFALDNKDYIRVTRLFVGEPVWTPHNRPSDDMQARRNYLEKLNIPNAVH